MSGKADGVNQIEVGATDATKEAAVATIDLSILQRQAVEAIDVATRSAVRVESVEGDAVTLTFTTLEALELVATRLGMPNPRSGAYRYERPTRTYA